MLNFIIGVKNSGKTKTAHKVLGECAQKGEGAMIIVPKQFTFDTDKGLLSLLGPKTACEIEVLSFSRLCHVAVSTYGGIKKSIAAGGMREIFMSNAVEALKDKLTVFAKQKNEIALVTKLLSEIDKMKNSGITADMLEESAEKITDRVLKSKLTETALIYRTYEAVLSQSHFDDGDMLEKVYEILAPTSFFEGKTIVIDGFKSFTHPEYKLIELMLRKAKNVYITLCCEDLNSINDLSAFAYINKTARKLRLIAGNQGVGTGQVITCEREADCFSEEMLHLERNLYKTDFEVYDKPTDKVSIIEADTAESECDAVARCIKALIREGKYRCRDIAVVFRSDEKYEKGMKASLKKYGLPLFEDRRQPVKNQPLICYVRNLLMIMSEGFNSDYIFRLIKTGLCTLEQEEISEIENYAFTWDITGKKWLSDFTGNPEGFSDYFGEKEKARLEKINGTRKKITEPLVSLREKFTDVSGKKAAELIYLYLRENAVDEALKAYALSLQEKGFSDLAAEQEQVWDILMLTLSEMAEAISVRNVTPKRFAELFELVISGKSLGKLPDGYDEVCVCSADRILTKSVKALFAVGMNSGVFPLEQKSDSLFSSFEKKKLLEADLEIGEDIKELTLSERFVCYSALSGATERVCLSYSTSSGVSQKLTESECVQSVRELFPECKKINVLTQELTDLIESEQSAFELMAKLWRNGGDGFESLRAYFSENEAYKDRLAAVMRATAEEDFAFKDKEVSKKLFGERMYFSASQLEVYSKCPFMYFCRYGVKAKTRPKAKLDAAMGGNVVHYVLEMLLKDHKGKDFLNMTAEEIDSEIRHHLGQYMRLYMAESENMSLRFNYLYGRMYKILRHLFDRLIAEFGDSDFEPCDFELTIGRDEQVKPFKVPLKQGSVELIGKIDRVDKMDLDGKRYIRIVDYKTGIKEFNLSDVFYGINMQMLLYLVSIWRGGTEFYESITPSGILYFPARLSACNVERDDSEEIREKKRMMTGKMSGMLVLDGDSASAMDKSKRSIFIPVKFDSKTGAVKGNFITLKQLERLGEMMDGIIEDMGNSLHDGIVPARPIYGPGHGETCAWCDYKDVCLKDKPTVRYAQKMSHDDCIRQLMGGEDSVEKVDTTAE
ncbi:MAG: PD-(D/E)XK nuclease family protein [Clostridia bacterium]|nr:PD-(D/E)XK nuclease family protein [Clostridia bacterium]